MPRVLIVDDDADNRELLGRLLGLWGFVVETAADGPEGLDRLLRGGIDVAVVDLSLPGFDGLEVARRVRATGPSVRLVALTGHDLPADRLAALAAGFDVFLAKPVEPRRLVAVLREPDSATVSSGVSG